MLSSSSSSSTLLPLLLLLALPLGLVQPTTAAHGRGGGLHERQGAGQQHHRLAQKLAASSSSSSSVSSSFALADASPAVAAAAAAAAVVVVDASNSPDGQPNHPHPARRGPADTTVWQTATVTETQTRQLTIRAAPPGATDAAASSGPGSSAAVVAGWEEQGCPSPLPHPLFPPRRLFRCVLIRRHDLPRVRAGFVDSSSARLLTGSSPRLGAKNTPAACIAACAAGGFPFAGVEYSTGPSSFVSHRIP